MLEVKGTCEDAFSGVRDTFAELFDEFDECGASCSVYYQGKTVLNLWGGRKDLVSEDPWQQDTLVNVFSTTKGVVALCVQIAIEQGLIDPEKPVSYYWPEYGCAGKKSIKVAWLLNHKAGQPVVQAAIPDDALYDWDEMVRVLAKEEPVWEPGTQHGYHMMTYGWLVGEVFRRAVGVTLSQFIQTQFVQPLGLDMHLGVGDGDMGRIAPLQAAKGPPPEEHLSLFKYMMANPGSLPAKALTNPMSIMTGANTKEWCQAEIPAANMHATAESLAALYGKVVCHEGLLSEASIQRCYQEESNGKDLVLLVNTRFGPGFMLQQPGCHEGEFGPGKNVFGHPGSGGSLAFGDPDKMFGFAYVMNQMGPFVLVDPRPKALLAALYECLP